MTTLLGIDAGTTVTKAVLFDLDGHPLATAGRRVPLDHPAPGHVERDQDDLWQAVADCVQEVLGAAGRPEVAAVGVTSHGDGVYLVDGAGRPTRPGIMSLDTRAHAVVAGWEADGTSDAALRLAGQRPWPSAPASLLRWLAEHEPEVLSRTRWALPAKDMLKHRLTGEVSTEPTEASLSFTDVRTQVYSEQVIDVYGLGGITPLLAPVVAPTAVMGRVTAAAAEATGLAAGTPVAAGAHDVDCSAIGSGVVGPGVASVVAGSFSINQVVSDRPVVGEGWCARNFITPGAWMNMSISPTSATNMEWFATRLCAGELAGGAQAGDPFGFVEAEVREVAGDPSEVLFLPFLYGSPLPVEARATFLGLAGWHRRGHLLRAVMEGVCFSHRSHVDALAQAFGFDTVRVTGGATRSRYWSQLFADVLRRPVELTDAAESGALGAALLAGIAAGRYASPAEAVARAVRVTGRYHPGDGAAALDQTYHRYLGAVRALEPVWGGRA